MRRARRRIDGFLRRCSRGIAPKVAAAAACLGSVRGAGASADAKADAKDQPVVQVQPVFCLLKASPLESLQTFLDSGQRKIDRWTAQHRCATVVFDDSAAFFNANTVEELRRLG